MIDISLIRENPDRIRQAISARQMEPALVDRVVELDERRRELIQDV